MDQSWSPPWMSSYGKVISQKMHSALRFVKPLFRCKWSIWSILRRASIGYAMTYRQLQNVIDDTQNRDPVAAPNICISGMTTVFEGHSLRFFLSKRLATDSWQSENTPVSPGLPSLPAWECIRGPRSQRLQAAAWVQKKAVGNDTMLGHPHRQFLNPKMESQLTPEQETVCQK